MVNLQLLSLSLHQVYLPKFIQNHIDGKKTFSQMTVNN